MQTNGDFFNKRSSGRLDSLFLCTFIGLELLNSQKIPLWTLLITRERDGGGEEEEEEEEEEENTRLGSLVLFKSIVSEALSLSLSLSHTHTHTPNEY